MLPASFIPRDNRESPVAPKTVTAANTRYLRNVTSSFLGLDRFGRRCGVFFFALVLDPFISRGTQFQEALGLFVESLAFSAIERGFSQNAVHRFGPEVILVIETVDGFHDFVGGEPGILNVSHLMAAFIHHFGVGDYESALHGVVVELSPRISVRHRDLNSFDVEFFREVDGVADGLPSLAWQT